MVVMPIFPTVTEQLTVLLPMPATERKDLLEYLLMYGPNLIPKLEHHITLIGFKLAKRLRGIPDIHKALEMEVGSIEWDWQLSPRYCHVVRNHEGARQESVIRWARVVGLDRLYQWISAVLQEYVATPPAHLTVLVQPKPDGTPSMGIGIDDIRDARLTITDLKPW